MKLNQAGSVDVDTLSTGALLPERKQVPRQQSAQGAFPMLARPWSAKKQTEITQLRAPFAQGRANLTAKTGGPSTEFISLEMVS